MKQLLKVGRLFYGIGIIVLGIHQIILKKFRPEILPPFPAWPHSSVVFPVLAGAALIGAGILITGLLAIKRISARSVCLCLGFCFLALFVICHLPYILVFSPDKPSVLAVWDGAFEELAYAGGAFVMAGSFPAPGFGRSQKSSFEAWLEKLIPFGRIFFSALILLYGISHFVYIKFVSAMVPKWFGVPFFWTYFAGTALIASAIAIILKIWIRPAAFLLSLMLFLWVFFIHIPEAIADPYSAGGNQIVRAFIALLFSSIALVIALTNGAGPDRGKTT